MLGTVLLAITMLLMWVLVAMLMLMLMMMMLLVLVLVMGMHVAPRGQRRALRTCTETTICPAISLVTVILLLLLLLLLLLFWLFIPAVNTQCRGFCGPTLRERRAPACSSVGHKRRRRHNLPQVAVLLMLLALLSMATERVVGSVAALWMGLCSTMLLNWGGPRV